MGNDENSVSYQEHRLDLRILYKICSLHADSSVFHRTHDQAPEPSSFHPVWGQLKSDCLVGQTGENAHIEITEDASLVHHRDSKSTHTFISPGMCSITYCN
jgi:hypothetical protein